MHTVFFFNACFLSEINELPLRQHFDECGTVEGVRLVRDVNSGMGKGFGYVLFEVGHKNTHLITAVNLY